MPVTEWTIARFPGAKLESGECIISGMRTFAALSGGRHHYHSPLTATALDKREVVSE
jgi:hypothetical protein